ncbi:MFS transporter [Thiomicrorhabdus lithotrophica]|uniref:MFS transporter n=1 Tax=Thiomicrorhabdus lithotrophica TaxID=2949997 RepID=A0ABY8CA19_9GAMM|nr:MFS transporter [Thiomicrorhabdus lithotrophica]WEJ61657.1 MFS transporter [Thiomicrorhabdus lithotrophica]
MSDHNTTNMQSNSSSTKPKPASQNSEKATEYLPPLVVTKAYNLITGDEDSRVCKEIPEQACRHQPRNFFGYLIANFLGKVADELASAKLILPWLMGALGAPSALVGFLVPIRESGVLLPQLFVAAKVRNRPRRKGVWLLGAALSGFALILMAITAISFTGATAGWMILFALVVFSLARGLCSVSAKDVLGKTVSKGKRGVLMGVSAGLAGVAGLVVGIYIEFYNSTPPIELLAWLLLFGGILWFIALLFFNTINEHDGATEGGGNAIKTAFESFSLLKTDLPFRHYVIGRILLLSSALVPPFYILIAQEYSAGELTGLGMLIISAGIASMVSAPLWGKLGDYSSKLVMAFASVGIGALGVALFTLIEADSNWLLNPLTHAFFFFAITVFHGGVRLGRKIYLVDLANEHTRATYVALSNTVIGIAMLTGGLIGLLADIISIHFVILLLSLIAFAAAWWNARLKEVSVKGD